MAPAPLSSKCAVHTKLPCLAAPRPAARSPAPPRPPSLRDRADPPSRTLAPITRSPWPRIPAPPYPRPRPRLILPCPRTTSNAQIQRRHRDACPCHRVRRVEESARNGRRNCSTMEDEKPSYARCSPVVVSGAPVKLGSATTTPAPLPSHATPFDDDALASSSESQVLRQVVA
ncbi:hypothetical protein Zm00014a_039520 [Zea mays]|uniref:Uncharacterized protein n=1 Tax=Zea mays TaxID=4577 RepID=A0A3L6FFE3_MAIZE|nr:hypothetical protein Zm00014a_039520 [Zea mays]